MVDVVADLSQLIERLASLAPQALAA